MRISDWSSDVCSSDLPGAKAGCAFFAPGFFAQAKKGGSRRHGAKAFDLCVAARQEGEQEQLAALAPPHPALRATFSRKREKGCLIRGSGLRATSLDRKSTRLNSSH